MKLSELEHLVAVMRAKADDMQVADPNVVFYDDDRSALLEALAGPVAYVDMDPLDDCAKYIDDHIVAGDSEAGEPAAKMRGDFAIPLKIC